MHRILRVISGCCKAKCGALLSLLVIAMTVHAQRSGVPVTSPPGQTSGDAAGGRSDQTVPVPGIDLNAGPDESPQMRVRRENIRKEQRKQRMVSSANRLLELTKQFQADLAVHSEITPENAKRLDDIAKLAREVKSRMED